MKRVLVGYDGSSDAEKAVGFAAELAAQFDAILIIAHVVAQPTGVSAAASMPSYARAEQIYQAGHDVLREAADQLLGQATAIADRHGLTDPETIVLVGSPAQQLAKAATAQHADVLVVGSRGHGEFVGLLLGSVSSRVSHIADCTVITVK